MKPNTKLKQLALANKTHVSSRARTRLGLWKAKFLEVLEVTPSVTVAAKAAGIDRTVAYDYRNKDPQFAEAWDAALQASVDRLEHQAWKFAIRLEGADTATASARERMAEFMLRAHRPSVYSEK